MKFVYFLIATLSLSSNTHALPSTIAASSILNGVPVEISLKSGNAKVFIFVSSSCPCSISHEKILIDLSQEFKEFSFIAIHSNVNESIQESKKHFEKIGFPFLVLQDNDAKIADEFGALKTPHAFIVDGKGNFVFSGGVTNSAHAQSASKPYLREALLSLRKGEAPNPKEVRSLGCVISRK